jgi:XTP/dITP diphosphohydrolase
MADFAFVTSNDHKVMTAKAVCDELGLTFERINMDLLEIQSDDAAAIARHKVEQAYEELKSPVAVTDDSWLIPGLNGFPGPYMKYINQWFRPQDFLNLTKDLEDRRIIMRQVIAYKDAQNEKVFAADIEATLLKEVRGQSVIPHFAVISFDGGKHSVAESEADGVMAVSQKANAWHQLGEWLRQA